MTTATKLAPQAASWYNKGVNIVLPEGATNTIQAVMHLLRRYIVTTLPPHAQDGNIPQKRCSSCPEGQQWHPATTEFYSRQKSSKDGLKSRCKKCQSEYSRAYYAEHCEEVSERRKTYYQEHQEHLRQYSAQYRIDNHENVARSLSEYNRSDRRKASKARYNATHRERNRRYNASWHEAHREEQRQYCVRYNIEHYQERLQYGKKRRSVIREELNARTRAYRRTERGRLMRRIHQQRRHARMLGAVGTYTAEDLRLQYKNQKGQCYYCRKRLQGSSYHADHVIPLSRGGSNDKSNIVIACPTCNVRKGNKLPHEWGDGGRLL